jgi:type I restriction enzyme S subunit
LAELCEAIATRRNAAEGALTDICSQVADKVSCEEADIRTYVSTESLLADKGGRQIASSLLATGKVTTYEAGDTLVSNIRPYFKKIWYADCNGTCSGDVIVFRANDTSLAPYIYACLRQDAFFEFVMTGSKETKMPRGDKKQMMTFPINPNFDDDDLATITSAIQQIGTNNRENLNLAGLRDTLLSRLMSGEIDVSEVELPTQPNNHLAASGPTRLSISLFDCNLIDVKRIEELRFVGGEAMMPLVWIYWLLIRSSRMMHIIFICDRE